MTLSRRPAVLAAVVLVALATSACAPSPRPVAAPPTTATTAPGTLAIEPSPTTPPTPPAALPTASPPSAAGAALVVLASLVVAPEAGASSYDRGAYPHWSAQASGCSTRVEVLAAESTTAAQVDRYGTCAVLAGDWWSAYDNLAVTDPAELDIDHVVALAEAHRSGASAWDTARREAFANDVSHPDSLVAVTSASNRSKSDSDPSSWLPPNAAYRCTYLAAWVGVKARWALSVDRAEHDAIAAGLAPCPVPTATAPSAPPPPTAAPSPAPAPPTTAPGGAGPTYANCAEVRAAGAAPIRSTDPGFSPRFDGDGDGVGCE